MKSKKSIKLNSADKAKQQELEKRIKTEKVKLDHPQGKERFEQVIKRAKKGSSD
jgi:hypothetical protein